MDSFLTEAGLDAANEALDHIEERGGRGGGARGGRAGGKGGKGGWTKAARDKAAASRKAHKKPKKTASPKPKKSSKPPTGGRSPKSRGEFHPKSKVTADKHSDAASALAKAAFKKHGVTSMSDLKWKNKKAFDSVRFAHAKAYDAHSKAGDEAQKRGDKKAMAYHFTKADHHQSELEKGRYS